MKEDLLIEEGVGVGDADTATDSMPVPEPDGVTATDITQINKVGGDRGQCHRHYTDQ